MTAKPTVLSQNSLESTERRRKMSRPRTHRALESVRMNLSTIGTPSYIRNNSLAWITKNRCKVTVQMTALVVGRPSNVSIASLEERWRACVRVTFVVTYNVVPYLSMQYVQDMSQAVNCRQYIPKQSHVDLCSASSLPQTRTGFWPCVTVCRRMRAVTKLTCISELNRSNASLSWCNEEGPKQTPPGNAVTYIHIPCIITQVNVKVHGIICASNYTKLCQEQIQT